MSSSEMNNNRFESVLTQTGQTQASDVLLVISWCIWLVSHFLMESNIVNYVDKSVFDAASFAAILLMCLVELLSLKRYSVTDILAGLIILLLVVSAYVCKSNSLLQAIIIIYLLRDTNVDYILKSFIYVLGIMLTVVLVLTFAGVVDNSTVYGREGIRYTLGFVWPSRAGNFLLTIALAYICLKREACSLRSLIFILCLSGIIYHFTNSRNPFLFTILLVTMWLYVRAFSPEGKSFRLAIFWSLVPVVIGIVTICVHVFYNPSIEWMSSLNDLTSKRLLYSSIAFDSAGLSPFGSPIFNDSDANPLVTGYLDSGYLRLLLTYGCVPFFIMLVGLCSISYLFAKRGLSCCFICLLCVLLRSTMDGGFVFLQYTPLLFYLLNTEIHAGNESVKYMPRKVGQHLKNAYAIRVQG